MHQSVKFMTVLVPSEWPRVPEPYSFLP